MGAYYRSSSGNINNLTDGAGFVAALFAYIEKGPDYIKQLQDEVVKLNALSKEQEEELHNAKALMQRSEELKAQIKRDESQHEANLKAYEKESAALRAETDEIIAAQKKEIEVAWAQIRAREEELATWSEKLDQRENSLKEKAAVVKGLF